MKFLHAADIHLDSPLKGLEEYEGAPIDVIRGAPRRALENLVDLAIREAVDFVVIAGDLYDGNWRDFNTGMFFVLQMSKLRDAGIRVYLIAGNHDAINTMTRTMRLPSNPEGDTFMLSHDQAESRRLEDFGVAIHGRSFANQAEFKNMVPEYPAPVSNWFNIGLLHTSLSGSEDHDTYAPCTTSDLCSKGYDYWALGHIHKRSILPSEGLPFAESPALYSGNIQGRHIREPGPRGCFVVSVDDRRRIDVRFHPLDVFRWDVCLVSCAGTKTTDDVLEQFRKTLLDLTRRHGNLPVGVRVILDGATQAHQRLASQRDQVTAEIRSAATIVSEGRVWIEKLRLTTSDPQQREFRTDEQGPFAELMRYLDELPNDDKALSQLTEELKDLAKKLPPELTQSPDGLPLTQIDWVREVVRELKPLLLDRLQG